MFTGIIETTAEVLERSETGIALSRPKDFEDVHIGQSIAVNGACLSVREFNAAALRFDVVPETFRRTNLAEAKHVNLERSLSASGRFEGHVVLGHVDAVATLLKRKTEGDGEWFRFATPTNLAPYFVDKGSVSLNGISLTIAKCDHESFEIAIIPHTLELTNLSDLKAGAKVNVEADYFAKLLYKWQSEE